MSRMNRNLARELRSAGVPKDEIAELTRAAERLSTLHVPGMSAASRQRIAARMPIDVEPERQRFGVGVRWVAASGFAVLAMVLGATFLIPGSSQPTGNESDQKARKVTQPAVPEQQLERQVQQLEQLQKQPVVDQQQVQKAKDDFEQTYKKYQKTHDSSKDDSKTKWNDYKSQWWWKGSSSSQPKSDGASSEPQSTGSQSGDDASSRYRTRYTGN